VTVDAVLYFRMFDPTAAVTKVNDAFSSTRLLAQTTLRKVLGERTLSEMLSDRDGIATLTQQELNKSNQCYIKCSLKLVQFVFLGTAVWGVKVSRVEMKVSTFFIITVHYDIVTGFAITKFVNTCNGNGSRSGKNS
jgi:erythrocyte band 7 integral membrane protein